MKKVLLPFALLLLFTVEILRVFFIMPFPGSQEANTITIAYFIHRNIFWIRILLLIIIFWQVYRLIKNRKFGRLTFSILFLLLFCGVFYYLNFKLNADKMFYQPKNKIFSSGADNKVGEGKLILGVEINGEAKAYPIEIIGYHHQVSDVVGNRSIMVTYCTVCRTGRIYDPVLNGKEETFRLVGMDHFNAMFEDKTTKSWWRQATGEAIAGKLKGNSLTEIYSEQTTLKNWLAKHPDTRILQPDDNFIKDYEFLVGFDEGTIDNDLEKRDGNSWQFKSWVIGIDHTGIEKAYDWNELLKVKIINDTIPSTPILVLLENDGKTFHVYERTIDGHALEFIFSPAHDLLLDKQTNSLWNFNGQCFEGVMKGNKLEPIQAYQEFYHSWKQFHPNSLYYGWSEE